MDKKERNRIAVKKYSESAKGKLKKQLYKEKRKEIKRKWDLNNHKKNKISVWKQVGIIWNDYDIIYDLYINATNCDYCSKEFKNSLDRHCDHDHDITDANNIRGFLCRVCNTTDVLKGYDIMELC